MNRKEFLSLFGMGAAAVACGYCLDGCKVNDNGITAPTNVDFTLDLTNPAYVGMKNIGGSIVNAGVIVAHATTGYVAVSAACTHQGQQIILDSTNNQFYCPAHGSLFATNGQVLRGPAGSPLGTYRITLTGNLLRVFS